MPAAGGSGASFAGGRRTAPQPEPSCCGGPQGRLEEEGWTRRFMAGPPRLEEAEELYLSMGLEVRLEPPDPEEFGRECSGCAAARALFRVIYTRNPIP